MEKLMDQQYIQCTTCEEADTCRAYPGHELNDQEQKEK
jgi:hypothetical protein